MLNILKRRFSHVVGLDGKKYTLNTQMVINGKWMDSKSGKTFPVVDPSTGKEFWRVAEGQPEDIELAVQAAKQALESGPWVKMGPL